MDSGSLTWGELSALDSLRRSRFAGVWSFADSGSSTWGELSALDNLRPPRLDEVPNFADSITSSADCSIVFDVETDRAEEGDTLRDFVPLGRPLLAEGVSTGSSAVSSCSKRTEVCSLAEATEMSGPSEVLRRRSDFRAEPDSNRGLDFVLLVFGVAGVVSGWTLDLREDVTRGVVDFRGLRAPTTRIGASIGSSSPVCGAHSSDSGSLLLTGVFSAD